MWPELLELAHVNAGGTQALSGVSRFLWENKVQAVSMDDPFLREYSAEHLCYEVDTFFGMSDILMTHVIGPRLIRIGSEQTQR